MTGHHDMDDAIRHLLNQDELGPGNLQILHHYAVQEAAYLAMDAQNEQYHAINNPDALATEENYKKIDRTIQQSLAWSNVAQAVSQLRRQF